MKLVFTKEEVAAALGKSARRFDELRPALEAQGFPRPVPGLGACWSILQVSQWVNGTARFDPPVIMAFPASVSSPEAATDGGGTAPDVLPPSPGIVDIRTKLEAHYGRRT